MEVFDRPAVETKGSGPTIPVEIMGVVLEHAARTTIDTDPCFAAALQLVCRTTRDWILPIIYEVFVVSWPKPGFGPTPSLNFLLELVTESPAPLIRNHVRHVILSAHNSDDVSWEKPVISTGEWHLDSVATDEADLLWVIQTLGICPRRLFIGHRHGYGAALLGVMIRQHSQGFVAFAERLDQVQTSWHILPEDSGDDQNVSADPLADEMEKIITQMHEVQTSRSIRIRIALDSEGASRANTVIRLVVALLRCPGVQVTLVQPTSHDHKDATVFGDENSSNHPWEYYLRASSLAIGHNMQAKLTIVRSAKVERPDTSIQYAAAIRSGIHFDM